MVMWFDAASIHLLLRKVEECACPQSLHFQKRAASVSHSHWIQLNYFDAMEIKLLSLHIRKYFMRARAIYMAGY